MASLSELMHRRRSAKVLGDTAAPLAGEAAPREALDRMLEPAGQAPFHYEAQEAHRRELASPVPWRMYKLDQDQCRLLLAYLSNNGFPSGKVANFLAAADFLIQVTWLPDVRERAAAGGGLFLADQRNMEHIAASGAAVQNLLLQATNAGFRTYWSSGDTFLRETCFPLLGIPANEILLGAVFLFPADVGTSQIAPGKLREARGEIADWSRWVEL